MTKYLLAVLLSLFASLISINTTLAMGNQDVYVVTNCSGVQVVRISAGQFEVRHVEANLPGCIKSQSSTVSVSPIVITTTTITNTLSTGAVATGSVSTGSVSTGTTSESTGAVFV